MTAEKIVTLTSANFGLIHFSPAYKTVHSPHKINDVPPHRILINSIL